MQTQGRWGSWQCADQWLGCGSPRSSRCGEEACGQELVGGQAAFPTGQALEVRTRDGAGGGGYGTIVLTKGGTDSPIGGGHRAVLMNSRRAIMPWAASGLLLDVPTRPAMTRRQTARTATTRTRWRLRLHRDVSRKVSRSPRSGRFYSRRGARLTGRWTRKIPYTRGHSERGGWRCGAEKNGAGAGMTRDGRQLPHRRGRPRPGEDRACPRQCCCKAGEVESGRVRQIKRHPEIGIEF